MNIKAEGRALSSASDALLERFYYDVPGFVDGTTEFHRLIWDNRPPTDARILEIGSGTHNVTTTFLAGIGSLTGIDISPEIADNRNLQHAVLYDGRTLPFVPESFDMCVSNYVLEHVQCPERHFQEVGRVLRPGGKYLFRTPNKYHYVAAISTCTSYAVHKLFANRLRGLQVDEHSPYPTFYRANTASAITRLCRAAHLRVEGLMMVEKEPTYSRCSQVLFWPMMAYERAVNASQKLGMYRANIFGCVSRDRKQARLAPGSRTRA